MRAVLLAVVLTSLFASVACANDTALGAVGGVLQPMNQHPSVQMVSEEIHIKLMPDDVAVTCRFVFKNTGGPVTVKMGFPEDHGGGGGSGFKYFNSRVDGKPVKARHERGKWTDDTEGRDWYVKDVRFERDQTRVVEDSYGGMAGSDSMGEIRYARYVLTTGKPWLGKIGKAVITVDTSAIRDYQTIRATPKGYSRKGNTITWTFTDFEPKEDIDIPYWPGFSRMVIDGRDLSTDSNFFIGERGPLAFRAVEGKRTWPVASRIEKGVLVAPAGLLYALLGVQASVAKDGRTATVSHGNRSIRVTVGSRTAVMGGEQIRLPMPAYLYHRELMVPVAAVGKALGAKVRYDYSTGKVHIKRLKPLD